MTGGGVGVREVIKIVKTKLRKEEIKKLRIIMKKYWADGRATEKQIKTQFKKGEKSEQLKKMWKEKKVTQKQKDNLFKKGKDKRRIKTQFKKGHKPSMETKKKMRDKRRKQITPSKDTSIEIKIQDYLKQLKINFFTHQYMSQINHAYQCDILIPSMKLVIECDGDYWHKYPIGMSIDHIRTEELLEKGFKVLRLWECEIKEMNLNQFKERIMGRGS